MQARVEENPNPGPDELMQLLFMSTTVRAWAGCAPMCVCTASKQAQGQAQRALQASTRGSCSLRDQVGYPSMMQPKEARAPGSKATTRMVTAFADSTRTDCKDQRALGDPAADMDRVGISYGLACTLALWLQLRSYYAAGLSGGLRNDVTDETLSMRQVGCSACCLAHNAAQLCHASSRGIVHRLPMNMAWRLCGSCTLCILFLHLQRWRLAELRLEEYAFVVLARLIGMFEDQVWTPLCGWQRCAHLCSV